MSSSVDSHQPLSPYYMREWFDHQFTMAVGIAFTFRLQTENGSIYTIALESTGAAQRHRRRIGAHYKFYQCRPGHAVVNGERYTGQVGYCMQLNRIAVFDDDEYHILRSSSRIQEVEILSPTRFRLGG